MGTDLENLSPLGSRYHEVIHTLYLHELVVHITAVTQFNSLWMTRIPACEHVWVDGDIT